MKKNKKNIKKGIKIGGGNWDFVDSVPDICS